MKQFWGRGWFGLLKSLFCSGEILFASNYYLQPWLAFPIFVIGGMNAYLKVRWVSLTDGSCSESKLLSRCLSDSELFICMWVFGQMVTTHCHLSFVIKLCFNLVAELL